HVGERVALRQGALAGPREKGIRRTLRACPGNQSDLVAQLLQLAHQDVDDSLDTAVGPGRHLDLRIGSEQQPHQPGALRVAEASVADAEASVSDASDAASAA